MDLFIGTLSKNIPPEERVRGVPLNKAVFKSFDNDIIKENDGDLALVSGTEKLKQDMIKAFMTDLGSNVTFPEYGSQLNELIGRKLNFPIMKGLITDDIIETLRTLQFVNKDNLNEDEQIDTLDILEITQSATDPRQIDVRLEVITVAGSRVKNTFSMTPEAV